MKELRTFSILLIPYLTACGGLYHIAYWNTFHINGLEYMGPTELITSFIYPFLSFFGTFFISFFIISLIRKLQKSLLPDGYGKETKIGKIPNKEIVISILVIVWLAVLIYIYNKGVKNLLFPWVIMAEFPLTIYLCNKDLFKDNKFRVNIISSLVFIPLISLASGNYYSTLIKENIKYKYTLRNTFNAQTRRLQTDTLKFLGRTEKYLFMTGTNNSEAIIIRSEKIDTLILEQFEEK